MRLGVQKKGWHIGGWEVFVYLIRQLLLQLTNEFWKHRDKHLI
jgi:hypothetical protein